MKLLAQRLARYFFSILLSLFLISFSYEDKDFKHKKGTIFSGSNLSSFKFFLGIECIETCCSLSNLKTMDDTSISILL